MDVHLRESKHRETLVMAVIMRSLFSGLVRRMNEKILVTRTIA